MFSPHELSTRRDHSSAGNIDECRDDCTSLFGCVGFSRGGSTCIYKYARCSLGNPLKQGSGHWRYHDKAYGYNANWAAEETFYVDTFVKESGKSRGMISA